MFATNHYRLKLIMILFLLPLMLLGRNKKDQEVASLNDLLPAPTEELSPSRWHKGKPFVLLREEVGLTLTPEVPTASADSLCGLGSVWYYDSMVSEEDWMGQQLLQLRFISPAGTAYRFSTGQLVSAITDSGYQPVIGSLYPLQLIQKVDSVLRARSLYILIMDERVRYQSDTVVGVTHEKFVPVIVDSVACGNELAPFAVYFHREDEEGKVLEEGSFFASLPGSREVGTSTSLDRYLALADPYLLHPDITPEIWNLIKRGSVQLDMTTEEVRLSWGRPSKIEKGASRTGMIELWYYSNNRILQFWDGRLHKMGIL